jgi:hypothetical protein
MVYQSQDQRVQRGTLEMLELLERLALKVPRVLMELMEPQVRKEK